jgi:hypothetical protein
VGGCTRALTAVTHNGRAGVDRPLACPGHASVVQALCCNLRGLKPAILPEKCGLSLFARSLLPSSLRPASQGIADSAAAFSGGEGPGFGEPGDFISTDEIRVPRRATRWHRGDRARGSVP